MPRSSTVAHAVLTILAASALTACGRSTLETTSVGGAGGAPPTGCQTDADCSSTPATPHCALPEGVCVECTTNSQCPADEVCHDHKCAAFCGAGAACEGGLTCCAPLCVEVGDDPENCAACGAVCGPYDHALPGCSQHACQIAWCEPGFADCDHVVANGCEVNTGFDAANCGACGKACPPGETCAGGTCVGGCGGGGTCPTGDSCCGTACVNTEIDPNNCGSCGFACAPAPHASVTCKASACAIALCAAGFEDCNHLEGDGCEVSTDSDPANCGGCGNACAPGETCSGGVCAGGCGGGSACKAGLTCCFGATCANTASDLDNCGGCGNVCPPIPNGTPACHGGGCDVGSCFAGYSDCNGVVSDGCEVYIAGDSSNCGSCGHACAFGASCVNGICQPVSCQIGGCPNGGTCCFDTCIDINSDLANCGGCGNTCPPSATFCQGGACCQKDPSGGVTCSAIVCPFPQQACFNQCIDTSSDPNNCGACGKMCGPSQKCINGSCQGSGCNGGPSCPPGVSCCPSGCTDTNSDPWNCGGCNAACPPGSACFGGQCQATCNGGPACTGGKQCCGAGCTDTSSDPNNCGGCGSACQPGAPCVGGQCQATCNGGPVCTGGKQCCAAGCTDTTSDENNCGGCGVVCGPNQTCIGSMCQTTCNGGPACTGGQQCCSTGCIDTGSDPANCGGCGAACPPGDTCVGGACKAPPTCNGGPACTGSQTCCPTGCFDTSTDPNHCGSCTNVCGATSACVGGTCAADEGAFNPIVNPTYLSPGAHYFTTITVPAGVTVYVGGAGAASGTLDLHATGDIVIDGTIDLSGGPGTKNDITSSSTQQGTAGSGGYTGEPYKSAAPSAACAFIAGNPGLLGFANAGTSGSCTVLSTTVCMDQSDPTSLLWTSPVAQYGGGAGVFTGYRAYGSGGGGRAGGAPGALGAPYPATGSYPAEQDCKGVSGGGGATDGKGGKGGNPIYSGADGILGQTQCPGIEPGIPAAYVGGGGGGSIGAVAAGDLAVLTTFQTGSGGGGGSADYLNRPVFGGTSGGGGGGGALRLSTPASITIHGQVLANGGPGGSAYIGNGSAAGCDPQPGAAGGGGSGGVIYLAAPSITVGSSATISAAGGAGGAQSAFATGGGGGAGGLGRIRLSVAQATCTLQGTFNPPLASGCGATNPGTPGKAYIGAYPN